MGEIAHTTAPGAATDDRSVPGELERPWHALPASRVLAALDARESGLSDDEAARRLAAWGPNALPPPPRVSVWRLLGAQFASLVTLLLAAAAVVALTTGDAVDAAAIAAVLVLNATLGFTTEWRARRAMEALRSLEVPEAVVVRGGHPRTIAARDLVPGDVILLEAGRATPADARLIAATELRAVESALTGESLPADKRADVQLATDTPLPDRVTMVYKATTIAAGSARAVVVATGERTEVGRIGALAAGVTDEHTPLERRLDALATRLAIVAIAAGGVVAGVELVRGTPIGGLLETGLAVAVAAVPEGLPAIVTITMALGLRRMARRHAVVRRLPSVESLGAATVVCTDKTGTLTAGEQTVTTIWVADRTIDVTGAGYAPVGEFRHGGITLDPARDAQLRAALEIASLANRAEIVRADGVWTPQGDPTDAALLVAARKAGLERSELATERPEVGEVPFSSTRMLMATFHRGRDGETIAFVKGAPRTVLACCAHVQRADGMRALDEADRAVIERANAAMAARGLRVIALARGAVAAPEARALRDLTFIALAGLSDPPAAGAPETIRALRAAGIRTIMLTGDQRLTAAAIARELGVLAPGEETLDGREVDGMTDERLAQQVERIGAFSRVSPKAKLRVVSALQRHGHVVAMLGDGINDAPALRKADIGVAMGRRGTDLAKEAAAVILTDDRFQTIAAAVEEGRTIYDNIRKFAFYLLSCNLGEILVLLGAGLAAWPLPLTPVQILWLNLVTDTFPAFALAVEPPDPNAMRRPPRDPRAPFLSAGLIRLTAWYALLIAISTLAALWIGLGVLHASPTHARTLSFTTLALAQLFHLGNARSEAHVSTLRRAVANPYALGAVGVTLALQVAAVMFDPLARVLALSSLTVREWMLALALALVPALVGQAAKLLAAAWRRRHHTGRSADRTH
jgi:Ca2+-transporting ATPase